MKAFKPRAIVVTTLCFCFINVFSQGLWTFIAPNRFDIGGVNGSVYNIYFVDQQVGFALPSWATLYLKTTDGGATWQHKKAPITPYVINFYDHSIGWISDGNQIYKTTDGGDTWIYQFTGPSSSSYLIWDMQFTDAMNGYAVGNRTLLKTNDGGNNWASVMPTGIDTTWKKVFFLNKDTGYVFSNDSVFIKTTNGGQTWVSGYIPYLRAYHGITGAFFYNEQYGFAAAGLMGYMYRTTNGGARWDTISTFAGNSVFSINGSGLVYGSDWSYACLSNDTGHTWTLHPLPQTSSFATFTSPNNGFVGGTNIYSTTDGGLNWQGNVQNYQTPIYAIHDCEWMGPNEVMLTDAYGVEEGNSDDGGVNWNFPYGLSEPCLKIKAVSDTCYFKQYQYSGIQRYENGIQTLSLSGTLLFAASRDSFIFYTAGNDSLNLYRTTDGGHSFTTIFSVYDTSMGEGAFMIPINTTPFFVYEYAQFVDWNTGLIQWFNHSKSAVKHDITTDGGNSWHVTPYQSRALFGNIKLSPTGKLYGLIYGGFVNGIFILDSVYEWHFVAKCADYSANLDSYLDFGWTPDSIMWAKMHYHQASLGTFAYSLNDGISWNNYDIYVGDITVFKQTQNGAFLAGTNLGEIIQYNGAERTHLIKGNAFYDYNLNGIMDGYDVPAGAYQLNITPTNATAYTLSDGNYIAAVDSGNYTISPAPQTGFHVAPTSRTVGFSSNHSSIGNDFAIQPNDTSIRNVGIQLIDWGTANPGFQFQQYISYYNSGFQPVQPTITYVHDHQLSFNSASITPSAQSGDTLRWNLPVIYPAQYAYITVDMRLDSTTAIETYLYNYGLIEPLNTDFDPANNVDSTTPFVLGSYDPNLKTVKPAEIPVNQTTYQTPLQYTIHFQNTGNDSTHFIVVRDKMSDNLDLNTLRVTGVSHQPFDYHIENNNELVFRFTSIQLPDSSSDPLNSQGFVAFTVQPKSLIIDADTIYNAANIYFDYNQPVVTNTAKTAIRNSFVTYVSPVNKADIKVTIYPNPATTLVNIESDNSFEYTLFDLTGRPLRQAKADGNKATIITDNLAQGMYYLRINQNGKTQGYSVCIVGGN